MLTTGRLRAVILNSGGANACTGPGGFQDTHATAEAVAAALSDWGTETGAIEVAVCSTGLIGDRLPMDKVLAGVARHRARDGRRADRRRRSRPRHHDHRHRAQTGCAAPSRDNWTVGGMAKGAGMLAPSLATMLLRAHHRRGRRAGRPGRTRCAAPPRAPSTGSTSTAAAPPTTPCCCWRPAPARSRPAKPISTTAVLRVCDDLCAQLQADAEGVTKRIAVTVTGAADRGRRR